MHLDHSGEAYFVREIDSSEETQSGGLEADSGSLQVIESFYSYEDRTEGVAGISRLEHSVSDSGAIQVRHQFDSSTVRRIDISESDANRKFYDFQDENCSQDGSMEISEYGSNRYGSFDGDNFIESQGPNAEVVLVSVDDHMLTALILASEQNADNLPLNTPQFHLGPGESADFCEGNEDMDSAADPWGSHRVDDVSDCILDDSDNRYIFNQSYSDYGNVAEVVQVTDGHTRQSEEPPINNSECEGDAPNDSEDVFRRIRHEDVFKSCLELQELANQDGSVELDITSSPSEASNLPEKSHQSLPAVTDIDYDQKIDAHIKDEASPSHPTDEEKGTSCSVDVVQQINEVVGYTRSVSMSDHSFSLLETEDELISTSVVDEAERSPQMMQPEEECHRHGMVQPKDTESNEEPQTLTTGSFEISLCRSELQAGMGLAAAAEAFKKLQISVDEFLKHQLLFLSARAIVQAYLTRSFLVNVKQDGKNLPNGPVVISPDGLFPSLYREVIRRAPHESKIACLEDIKALFPPDHNPFYAGFGNRDTDELSYRKIGIPKGKIFIINPKGEVASSHQIDVKSYTSLHTLVNDMFPPTSMVEQEDYNSWNYWKVPIPDIDC